MRNARALAANVRAKVVAVGSVCAAAIVCVACGGDDTVVTLDAGADVTSGDSIVADATAPTSDAADASVVACGDKTCASQSYRGVATLPACCASPTSCGVDLTAIASLEAVPNGCFGTRAPGVADGTCPSYPARTMAESDRQGCCRPDRTCGVFVRLGASLDLGCVPASGFVRDASAVTPCGGDDAGSDAGTDGATDAATDGDPVDAADAG